MGFGAKLGGFASGMAAGYKLGRTIKGDWEEEEIKGRLKGIEKSTPQEDVRMEPGEEKPQPGMEYDEDTGTMVPSVKNFDQGAADRFEEARGMDQHIMPERGAPTVTRSNHFLGAKSDKPFTRDEIADLKLGARAGVYREYGRDEMADKIEHDRALLKGAALQREAAGLTIDKARRELNLGEELAGIDSRSRDRARFEQRGGEEGYIKDVNAERAMQGMQPLTDEEAAGVRQSLGAWSNPLSKYEYDKEKIAAFYKAGDTKGAESAIRRAESRVSMDFMNALGSGNDKLATALYNAYPNGHDIESIHMDEKGMVSITDAKGTREMPFGQVAKYALSRVDPDLLAKAEVESYLKLKNLAAEEELPSKKAQTEYIKEKTETEKGVNRALKEARANKLTAAPKNTLTTAENNGIWSEAKTILTNDGVVDTQRLAPVASLAASIFAKEKAAGGNMGFAQAVYQAVEAAKDAEFSEPIAKKRAHDEAEALRGKFGRRAFQEYGTQEKFEEALARRYLEAGSSLTAGRQGGRTAAVAADGRTAAVAPPDQLSKLGDILKTAPEGDRQKYVDAFKKQFPKSAADADRIAAGKPAAEGKNQEPSPTGRVKIYGETFAGAPQDELNRLKAMVETLPRGSEQVGNLFNAFEDKYPGFYIEAKKEGAKEGKNIFQRVFD